MWYDFYPTFCVFYILSPRLGDRKHITRWISHITSQTMGDPIFIRNRQSWTSAWNTAISIQLFTRYWTSLMFCHAYVFNTRVKLKTIHVTSWMICTIWKGSEKFYMKTPISHTELSILAVLTDSVNVSSFTRFL
jgi:hypothetical protein